MTEVRAARLWQGLALAAWLVGIIGFVLSGRGGPPAACIAAAGALFVLLGVATLADWGGLRDGLHRVQRPWGSMYPNGSSRWWLAYGGGIVFVGSCWLAIGIADL